MGASTEEWFFKDRQIIGMQQMAVAEFLRVSGIQAGAGSSPIEINVNIEGSVTDDNLAKITGEIKELARKLSKEQLDVLKSRGTNIRL
jgi:hypothetical protein